MTEYLKAAEVAAKLNIKTSTLRRYSDLLEKYNSRFPRNYANQRLYRSEHIKMIKNLQLTKDNRNLLLVEAVEILTEEWEMVNRKLETVIQECETLERDHEARRWFNALTDIVEKIGEDVYRGQKEKWDELWPKYTLNI